MANNQFCSGCGATNRMQSRFCTTCGDALLPNVVATGQLSAGTFLQKRYLIQLRLGQGGYGAVYKACDTKFGNRLVAIKEMGISGLTTSQEIIDVTNAFKQESIMLAGLFHKSLPRVYDHFCEANRWYMVMDYIEGETLESFASGQLGASEVVAIGMQLCDVLAYLHNLNPPVIFRDLKPANIMRRFTGELFLIDFGIARLFKSGQAKDTVAVGSIGHAAPEQFGRAQTTEQSDIYSLGATLHQLLTGDDPSLSPFVFAPLQGRVPDALAHVIAQMVEIPASKRPCSMQVVHQMLQDSLTGNVIPISVIRQPQTSTLPTVDIPAAKITMYVDYGDKCAADEELMDKAIEWYDKALKLDPYNIPALLGRGRVVLISFPYDAIPYFQRVLDADQNHVLASCYKGISLWMMNNTSSDAVTCFDNALTVDQGCILAYLAKGVVLAQQKKRAEAEECFESAMVLDRTNTKLDDTVRWYRTGLDPSMEEILAL